MASSELSNALNPYINPSRSRTSSFAYSAPYGQVPRPSSQYYVPHRSELELAISEPPPPPPPEATVTTTAVTRQANPANVQAVQELLRIVVSTRESHDIERRRRMAWEQEQEAKFAQREAEMERLMHEMRQEITILRSNAIANVNAIPPPSSGLLTPQHNMSPPIAIPRPPQPVSPISPISQPSSYTYPAFVQGSSSQPYPDPASYGEHYQISPQPELFIEIPVPSVTPSPSPQLTFVQPSQLHHELSASPPNIRKRHTSELSSDDEDGGGSDSSASNNGRPFKRHAIRDHILRLMHTETDKELPDSHKEGVTIGPDDPVRFVWDKTTKQSVHNSRMKARVIADIKENRRLYKHVSDKDFGKKSLESAFEASFVTFRQKFRTQRDDAVALHHKKREDNKARKSRHLSRRKTKLSNRSDARLNVDSLQHVTFDGALQLECMSSEESDCDDSGTRPSGMLRTRGYQWRSTRLKRFYGILDDGERADKFLQPKRGVGRKERCTGPPKDEFSLPPKRVATWMVSRRWIKASQVQYPDLPTVLATRIEDPLGFDWDGFNMLGEESELSGDESQTLDDMHIYTSHQTSIIQNIHLERIEQATSHPSEADHIHRRRAKELIELHDQVQTSVNLLDSLESFLSTFQKDLSAVSGQISELQDRSKDIENRLKSRRKIEKPLSNLISDITIPPTLATLVLDSPVGEPWIEAIQDFERRLETTKARSRVKAARDLGEVAEGLRIVTATKLRAFFLALFQPIRGSVTTNMQVIQTSVLLKYSGLFAFLQRQAPNVAHEVQRSYIGAARVYYETGFRRYSRSLGWIKARSIERHEPIVTIEQDKDLHINSERLSHARIEGPGVTLAYMADDKLHEKKEPVEALLRSLLLVLMDNATTEYTFVQTFFFVDATLRSEVSSNSLLSPETLLSPDRATFADQRSISGSDYGGPRVRTASIMNAIAAAETAKKEEQASSDAIWKQIMDPVISYVETFVKSVLDPVPPAVPLLTMIRLTEDVVLEVQKRNCPPVEFFVFGLRLQMWPVFQKVMAEHVESLKKLAEGTSTGYFSRAVVTTDAGVANELSKLILRHTNSITDAVAKATALSTTYESLLQGLSKGTHLSAHPKSQQEMAYWANLEEDARRKIVSAGRRPQR
ncbi:hypothetical protein DXG03_000278 [Asterophora parasitica]|uniref:Uncharacterized protein n=1 Tax=Asterophora parasitica TaxID=117018 RepID=A0A9P7KGR7_9AGAR|nr:hypothetical protein DXG03_000278 [Asterophora parasitica]